MIASFEGHAGVVQVLIEAKAQINTQDKVCYSTNIKNNTHTAVLGEVTVCLCPIQDGFTALHLAAQEGKIDVVRLLLTESEILVNAQTKV